MTKFRKWLLLGAVVLSISLVLVLLLPMYSDYRVRTRLGEGLVLASTYKNVIVDNMIQGRTCLSEGAPTFEPTHNTELIEVTGDGKIIILSRQRSGGIVLILTPNIISLATEEETASDPVEASKKFKVAGWSCQALNYKKLKDIPAECRPNKNNI